MTDDTNTQPDADQTHMTTAAKRRPARLWLVVALIAGVAGLGGWVWNEHVKDHVLIRNYGVVEEGKIYRAGRQTPATFRKIDDRHDIRTIVDLGMYLRDSDEELMCQRIAEEMGAQRVRFDLAGDATGNPNDYVAALRVMADESNHPLLIQCGAGAQRTSLAVMLYRHLVQGKPFTEVYPEAFDYKHEPRKDWILLTYLADHIEDIRTAYENGGWIEGHPIPDAARTNALLAHTEPRP